MESLGILLFVRLSQAAEPFAGEEPPAKTESNRPAAMDGASTPISGDTNSSPSSTSEGATDSAIDPELARAAEEDSARRHEQSGDAEESHAESTLPLGKMNPDLSFILDVGGAWHSKANHFHQGGHAMDDTGFFLQGLELAASASVDPFFRFDTNFQLTEGEVEEAYLTTLALPYNLQARAGLMNAAFGRQNSLHLHAWNFSNPPLSHTRFMSQEHLRGPGAELSVLFPLPWYLTLTGQVFGTSEEAGFEGVSFCASEATDSERIDELNKLLFLARVENFLELSTDFSLLLGLSGASGRSPFRADGRSTLVGGDVYLKYRPLGNGGDFALSLTGEYLLRTMALEQHRLRDHGGYAELDAQLTKRWITGVRLDTTSLWKGPSPDLEIVPGWQRRMSASITFLPSHFSKLRVQGDLGKDRDREGRQYAVFLQAEVSAGEHGAHKF